jgi:hypothetical protein
MKNLKRKRNHAEISVSSRKVSLTEIMASRTRMSGNLRAITFAACFDVCHRAGIRTYLTGEVMLRFRPTD